MGPWARRGSAALGFFVALWALGPLSWAGAQTTPSITSPPPPVGTVGTGYLHQFQASPMTPDPTFSVTSGTLPPGLSLSPTGFLSGAPEMAGSFGPTTVCASNGVAPPACQGFTITIAKVTPGLVASPSAGGPVGTAVRERASLIGAFAPTGSVTFRLFSDASCTNEVFTSTNVVDANGVATSGDFTPSAPGTYYWTARYSGDANNEAVESGCRPTNSVTITGSGTTTTTTSTTSTLPPTTTTSTSSTLPTSTTTTATSTSTSTSTSTTSTSTSTTVPTGTTSSSTTSSSTSSTSTSTTSPATTTSTTAPASTTSTAAGATTTTAPGSTSTTTTPAATTTVVPATTTTAATVPATTTTAAVSATTTTVAAGATTTSTAGAVATTTTTVPAPPSVQASPQQVAAGDTVTLTGSGFPPGSPVQAELFSDPVLLGATTTDASGSFRLTVTIPVDTAPGFHTVRVSVVGGTVFAETTLFVSGASAAGAGGGLVASSTGLSRTGSDATRPARLALGLVVAGFVLVGVAWRSGDDAGPTFGRRGAWPPRRRTRLR